MLELLHLTRRRNTSLFLFLLLALVLCSTWWLFGLVWTVILCAAHGLSYCTCSYVCYRPEAKRWREALVDWYDQLFIWAFNYSHSPAKGVQSDTVRSSGSARNHSVGQRSKAETSLTGEGLLNSAHPPHPVAELDRKGGEEGNNEGEEVAPSLKCHKEAQKIIQLLMKDFIRSWYLDLTNDIEFLEDVQKVLEHVALEVNVRVQQMNMEQVVVELLELILPYLEVLNKAGCRSYNGGLELFDVINNKCLKEFEANPKVAHYALRSASSERLHYRQALDAILQTAFPPEYARCDVAGMFVRELLLKNLIEPLFDLLCEPAFLYETIPMILSKASPEKVSRQLEDIVRENEELDHILNRGRLIVNIVGSHGGNSRRFHSSSGHFGQSAQFSMPSAPPQRSPGRRWDFSRPHSIAQFSDLRQTSSGIYESGSWLSQSTRMPPSPLLRSRTEEDEYEATYPPLVPSPRVSPMRSRNTGIGGRDPSLGGRTRRGYGPGMSGRYGEQREEEEEYEEDLGSEDGENSFEVVDGEFAVVQLAPIYIERHVRVVRESSHIAYIFKFPKWMLSDGDLLDLGVLDTDTHLEGIKRFSEFTKFHDALLSSPLGIHVKGLNLPQKRNLSSFISKLPFTSAEPDATVLLERKEGLEKYLQSISSVGDILANDLFKNFLKSAVQDLKDSNIVNPTRTKKLHRKSFLGRVKPEDALVAEPVPERQLESVLSSFLNTNLPLPCNTLNSIHGVKKQRRNTASRTIARSRSSHTSIGSGGTGNVDSPSKPESSSMRRQSINYSSSSLGPEQAPHVSSSSPTSSLSSSMDRTHSHASLLDSMQQTSHFEHSSTVVPDDSNSVVVQAAVEAIHDEGVTRHLLHLPDVVHSSVRPSRMYCDGEEADEERHTIGGSASSSLTHSSLGFSSGRPSSTSPPASPSPLPPPSPPPSMHSSAHCRYPKTSSCKKLYPKEKPTHQVDEQDGPGLARKNSFSNKNRNGKKKVEAAKLVGVKMLLYKALSFFHWIVSWIVFIVHRGMEPLSQKDALGLLKEEQEKAPFTNALFCLGSEVSRRHCPRLWACEQDTQLALLVLAGGGMERFLWRELRLVVYDEVNWTRSLYVLRHTLWPGGTFMKNSNKKPTEAEVEVLKRKAADSFKKFLPNFFPHIVGPGDYDQAVVHCLDCLGNPKINRHFLLSVVDVLMLKLVPQLADTPYQKQLMSIRTRQPTQMEPEYDITL